MKEMTEKSFETSSRQQIQIEKGEFPTRVGICIEHWNF